MTVREFLREHLEGNGLWPKEAEAVIGAMVASSVEAMANRWDDFVEGYPPFMKSLWIATANKEAVTYIDANCPRHFARPMFTGEVPA